MHEAVTKPTTGMPSFFGAVVDARKSVVADDACDWGMMLKFEKDSVEYGSHCEDGIEQLHRSAKAG